MRTPRIVANAAGVWLLAAPSVLGYGGTASDAHRVVGSVGAAAATISLSEVTRSIRWIAVVAGILAIATAWVGTESQALVSAAIAGGLMVVGDLIGSEPRERLGGGWRAVIDPMHRSPDGGERPQGTSAAS